MEETFNSSASEPSPKEKFFFKHRAAPSGSSSNVAKISPTSSTPYASRIVVRTRSAARAGTADSSVRSSLVQTGGAMSGRSARNWPNFT